MIQTTDDASLGEVGNDSVVTKENHTEGLAMSHLDNKTGKPNDHPEVMKLFKVSVLNFVTLRSYLLLTFLFKFSSYGN